MAEAMLARAAGPFFTTKGTRKGAGLYGPRGRRRVVGVLLPTSRPGAGNTAELWLPAPRRRSSPSPMHRAERHGRPLSYRAAGRRRPDQPGEVRDAEGSRPSGGRGARRVVRRPRFRATVRRPTWWRRTRPYPHEANAARRRDPRLAAHVPIVLAPDCGGLPKAATSNSAAAHR